MYACMFSCVAQVVGKIHFNLAFKSSELKRQGELFQCFAMRGVKMN